MSGGHTPMDGFDRQDSMSFEDLDSTSPDDAENIGEIPDPSSPIQRPSSSLTVENLRLFEEASEQSVTGSPVVLRSVQDSARTSSPLGPVRTGRGSPVRVDSAGGLRSLPGSRPTSQTRMNNPSGLSGEFIRTGSSKPLPPIGGERSDEDEQERRNGSVSTDDKTISNSDRPDLNSRSSQPTILGYRRERTLNDNSERSLRTAESVTRSERSVSFKDEQDTKTPSQSPDKVSRKSTLSPSLREVVRRNNPDGTDCVGVSIGTETEWSWLESMTLAGKTEGDLQEGDKTKTQERRPRKDSQASISYISEVSDAEQKDSPSESEYSDDDVAPLPTDTLIPSIGPPRIIQYQRESDRVGAYPDNMGQRGSTADTGIPSFDSFSSFDLDDMGGDCEFCQQDLKVFPTPEMVQTMTPDEIYCCTDYQNLVEFTLTHSHEASYPMDEMIDIQPHAPYGSKQARRAAKERAAQRMLDREVARQSERVAGANQANFYALQVARQMKTINYQLSSQKCLDEGWTIQPPTPNDDDGGPPQVFEPEPTLPPPIMSQTRQGIQDPKIVKKFYEEGNVLMIMFPDGTGNVFYPSGNIAILITSTEKGQYTYLLYEDFPNNAPMLGMFEPSGCTTCYHSNGNIRLNLDQYGGIFTDPKGAIKKKWSWKDQVNHVHAPPLQPICFAINKNFSVRCMAQEQVFLSFNCNTQTIRFNVGVKLKLIAPQLIPEEPIDDHALYMSEVKAYVELIFDKIQNQMKFSKSPKLDNLPPSLKLKNEILRNEQLKTRRSMKYVTSRGKDAPVVTVN